MGRPKKTVLQAENSEMEAMLRAIASKPKFIEALEWAARQLDVEDGLILLREENAPVRGHSRGRFALIDVVKSYEKVE